MININHITKWVNSGSGRIFLLRDINMRIAKGEFVSIMGPSGSGKTTLLNVLGMLDDFDEGEYNFMGEQVHTLKERRRSELHKNNIGFIFQAYHLIDELTVAENIETPLIYHGMKQSERKAAVADMLDRFTSWARKTCFPPSFREVNNNW